MNIIYILTWTDFILNGKLEQGLQTAVNIYKIILWKGDLLYNN